MESKEVYLATLTLMECVCVGGEAIYGVEVIECIRQLISVKKYVNILCSFF